MNIEQTLALIQKRRSVRRFTDQRVKREHLELLGEAAIWAPSGSNAQAWQLVVVDDENMLQRLTAFLPGILQTPPALVCLCVDYERELDRAGKMGVEVLGMMDVAMAAQNIMLAAEAIGLSSCVVRGFHEIVIETALKLPEHIKPELLVIVGYPHKPVRVPTRRPLSEVLHWQEYGQ